MRWEVLLEDLQSQFDAGERLERDDAAWELLEAEAGQVGLADRLRARAGDHLTVRLRGGQDVAGTVLDAAPQWLLLAQGDHRALVPLAAVAMAWPLGVAAPGTTGVERRLRVTHALRALARQGTRVRVLTDSGELVGWMTRVGADHLDVRPEQETGPRAVVLTVALGALLAVRTA